VLTGKIQERYGVTKAEARKQIDHWASKFHTPDGAIGQQRTGGLTCQYASS
jgi:hypothetical protein